MSKNYFYLIFAFFRQVKKTRSHHFGKQITFDLLKNFKNVYFLIIFGPFLQLWSSDLFLNCPKKTKVSFLAKKSLLIL